MKFLYTLLLSMVSFGAFAQYYVRQHFESPFDDFRANFYIDTVNYSNNKWQIGKPQKTTFDSAYSFPNAIVTDTLHPYSAHDTSVFYFTMWGENHGLLSLSFFFHLDIDSLCTAKIEISGDNGVNWIDPFTEDTTYMFNWSSGKPRFDTSTTGWSKFDLNMDTWSFSYPGSSHVFPLYRSSDTVLYRFTFISGDSLGHHDGWMMDDFVGQSTGRVATVSNSNDATTLNIYPNPTNGIINIHPNFTSNITDRIVVYNMQGQQVYDTEPKGSTVINLPLPNGVYSLKYYGSFGVTTNRVVIIKQ